MKLRSSQVDWLVFLALGFMWGSSYLFIKLAVDDFGTFTLVALRLLVGAALLWVVIRLAHQPLPREPRIYGHLFVMALVNIVDPVRAHHLGGAVGRLVARGDPDLARAAVRDRHRAALPRTTSRSASTASWGSWSGSSASSSSRAAT